jgi:hypothetical protein
MMNITLDPELANETKALVALAFRNGPIEDLHGGKTCPTCSGQPEFSYISVEQMKTVMKNAVDTLYRLLWQRKYDPNKYQRNVEFGLRYSRHWDGPELRDTGPETSVKES